MIPISGTQRQDRQGVWWQCLGPHEGAANVSRWLKLRIDESGVFFVSPIEVCNFGDSYWDNLPQNIEIRI